MENPNFTHSIEITHEAFVLLKGNDEKSWRDFQNNEHAEDGQFTQARGIG